MSHFCKLPSVQPVVTFSIPLGETWELGLWGVNTDIGEIKPSIENAKVALLYPPLFAAKDGIAKFAVKALSLGETDLNGTNSSNRSWAYAKIVVSTSVLPPAGGPENELLSDETDYSVHAMYVDNGIADTGSGYDQDTKMLTVKYVDGSSVGLNYGAILSGVKAARGGSSGPGRVVKGVTGYMLDRKTKRIVPLQYTEKTAPNIAFMVLEAEAAMQNQVMMMGAAVKFLEIIKVYATAGAAMRGAKPTWKAVPGGGSGGGSGAGGGFKPIPYGQSADSLGRSIGSRAAEGASTAGKIGEAGPSWINRILAALRPLKLSPKDSAEVVESATKSAGYGYGPRAAMEGGTIVVTSARMGAGQFIIAIRPDGTIQRGTATIEFVTTQFPPTAKLTNVVLAPP